MVGSLINFGRYNKGKCSWVDVLLNCFICKESFPSILPSIIGMRPSGALLI